MAEYSIPIRYWPCDGPMPVDLARGSLKVGIAYHQETGERLATVQVYSQEPRELVFESWLTGDTSSELVEALDRLGPWFGRPVETQHTEEVDEND